MPFFARRPAWPQLRFLAGAIARHHRDELVLTPLPPGCAHTVSVRALPEGGHGILLHGAQDLVLAQYPTARLARRQLRHLAGTASGGGWTALARGGTVAALLFLAWFLFVLPGEPMALAARENPASVTTGPTPAASDDPVAAAPARPRAPPVPRPAFQDDPAASVPDRAAEAAPEDLEALLRATD